MTDLETVSNVGEAGWLDEKPIPPRYWWLKRILAAIGVLVLALACLRWWWGWEAHRRLQAEIDKYIAAGEPVYPRDFDPPHVSKEENAATLLLEAAGALTLTTEQTELVDELAGNLEKLGAHLDQVATIVESNAKPLELVRQARLRPGADWGVRFRSPAINTLLPSLSGQRRLYKLLRAVAPYHHAVDDDTAAIETLRDMLRLADAVDTHPSCLIVHLVAGSINAGAAQTIEWLAPDLCVVGSAPAKCGGAGSATRSQVSKLIESLLNETRARDGLVRATLGERMLIFDTAQMVIHGQMSLSSLRSLSSGTTAFAPWELAPVQFKRPVLETDVIFSLRRTTRCISAARSPNWPAASAVAPHEPLDLTPWQRMTYEISSMMLPSFRQSALSHFRGLTMRRMAATALAIRLYEIEEGRRPGVLTDLVPDCLPSVPVDPFADDQRLIGYRLDGTRAVLYSVGSDGADDGGACAFREDGRGIDWDKLDIPFFLDGERPRQRNGRAGGTGGSTESPEAHHNQQDARRDADQNQDRDN